MGEIEYPGVYVEEAPLGVAPIAGRASFYANLIHTFRANYTKPVAAESDATSPRPYEQYQSLSVRDRESEEDAVGSQEERK